MTETSSLASRVLFLTIHCNRFGNLRRSNVKLDTTAEHKRFHAAQQLLDSPELDAITKRDNAVKKQVEAFVLPYKIACAILPQESGKEVKAILTAYEKIERPTLVKAFIATYISRVADAKIALKEEFVEGHYPTVEEIEKEFSFDWNLFSLDLPEDMKDKAASMIVDVTNAVADALAASAHGLTKKLADSLSTNEDGSAKKICDTHFEKQLVGAHGLSKVARVHVGDRGFQRILQRGHDARQGLRLDVWPQVDHGVERHVLSALHLRIQRVGYDAFEEYAVHTGRYGNEIPRIAKWEAIAGTQMVGI